MIGNEVKQDISAESISRDIEAIGNISIIPQLLNVVCRTTGMRFAAVARVTDEKWVTCSVQDEISFGLKPGDELDLKSTICNEIRQSGKPVIIDHVAEDPDFCDHNTPAMYGFQSYISMPIFRKNGDFFGTLCAIDPDPKQLKTDAVTHMFSLFSDLIAFHLNAADELKISNRNIETERALHKTIEQNQEKLSVVIDASELGTWEVDFATRELHCSDRYREILGFPKGVPLNWDEARRNIYPADMPVRAAAFEEAMQTGKLVYTGRVLFEDKSVHWIEAKGKIFFNDRHEPVKMIGTVRDINDEKKSAIKLEEKVKERTIELNEKNEELEKANKELQSFAYISSHDLQEPLRKIQTFVSLIEAEEDGGMKDKVKDYFRRMKNAAERMQMLIVDLLSYSRASTGEKQFEEADLGAIISQVTDNLHEELQAKNAELQISGMCTFNMIPFQMRQVFQNLISNSIKFSSAERELKIKIDAQIVNSDDHKNLKLHPASKYCKVCVTDNGIGFDEEYNEKIFELFQRLHPKATYTGTGIGLSIVKRIAENHSGTVTAEGKPGEGAVFCIYLKAK